MDDDELKMKGVGGKVLKYIAYTIIVIGVFDFMGYNAGIWDVYLGYLMGSSLEYWTFLLAFGIACVLFFLGSQDSFLSTRAIWMLNVIVGTAVAALIIANITTMFNKPGFYNTLLIRGSSLELCPTRNR